MSSNANRGVIAWSKHNPGYSGFDQVVEAISALMRSLPTSRTDGPYLRSAAFAVPEFPVFRLVWDEDYGLYVHTTDTAEDAQVAVEALCGKLDQVLDQQYRPNDEGP